MENIALTSRYDFNRYAELLSKAPEATVYHSKAYMSLIADETNSKPEYLALEEDSNLLGVLPLCIKENTRFGNVANSNPYFGSYGGVVLNPDLLPRKKELVKAGLFSFFHQFAKKNECVISVLITSPFDMLQHLYAADPRPTFIDRRLCQAVSLPQPGSVGLEKRLLEEWFSKKCRGAVKKAERLGVRTAVTEEPGSELDQFYDIYKENAKAVGAKLKTKAFFSSALGNSPKGSSALRYATYEDRLIGGIFHFFFNEIVEYYQPAIEPASRSTGATNLLIHEGLKDASKRGCSIWNFGGTWPSLEQLYKFKRSFGANDYSYTYFVTAYKDISEIRTMERKDIAEQYPDFYVIPYSELKSR
jgi:hypothetical protein